MKYSYTIKLDINKDIWNWFDANREPSFQDFNWRDNLKDSRDLAIFDAISKLGDAPAKRYLQKSLTRRYHEEQHEIDDYTTYIKAEFDAKFEGACRCVERLTGRKLCAKKFVFWLTTFPRCPYDESSNAIFVYITYSKYWGGPIENFIHEALHLQFHHYWQQDVHSPVSRLPDDDFDFIKESLTVIIDDSLKPLISHADEGYEAHAKFRKALHNYWMKNHDFDKLVQYAVDNFEKYK